MHSLKILNTFFCTAQVLLLCVKSCLPPLHNYSEIDGIVLLITENIDWILNGIYHAMINVVFFFQYVQSLISLFHRFCLLFIPHV